MHRGMRFPENQTFKKEPDYEIECVKKRAEGSGGMKRIIVWIACAALLCTGLLSGCQSQESGDKTTNVAKGEAAEKVTGQGMGNSNINKEGFPIVNEPITLTVYGARDQNQADWDEVFVLNKYEEMTGIHMDYQEVPEDGFEENKQLLFASNELPDVFLRAALNNNQISMYGVSSGQLMPLDDLIEEYAPNISALFEENPQLRQSCLASDGHIYALPRIDLAMSGVIDFKQWINKVWLDNLGLEVPTTLEEFKEVLIAFRDQDPNGNGEADEIPLGIREPSSIYQLGGSFGLSYQMRDTYDLDEDGKIHNWLCDDKFKDYLMWMNELYEEKLLWQDYYKNDRPSWRSNLAGEKFGAMYMPYSDVFLNCEKDYIGYEPLIGPTGEKYWSDGMTGAQTGCFALSSTCSNPEAAIRWVDYFFGEEGSEFFAFGIEGETYYIDEEGIPRYVDEILNAEEGFMTAQGKINLVPGNGFPYLKTQRISSVVGSNYTEEVAACLIDYLPEVCYDKPAVMPEDIDRVVAIEQDLVNYRDESVSKFIIGEWEFDMWDEYCQTLEQIGIRELEEIYQRALDAIQ